MNGSWDAQNGGDTVHGKAVKRVNEMLGCLRLEKHPDKTFIGRIEQGFDFLGYHFGPEGFTVAAKTIEQFVAPAIRLYEQEPGEAFASARLGLYVRRWVGWAPSTSYGDTNNLTLQLSIVSPKFACW